MAPGALWVGTDRGLNLRPRRAASRVERRAGLPSNSIQALIVDASGTLWVGTSRGVTPAAQRDVRAHSPAADSSIAALGTGADGALYIASKDATLQVYAERQLRDAADDQPALRNVDAIYTDAQGVVWLGTAGDGLLALDHGQMTRYTVRDGLFDDSIYAILGDGHGRLWMACSRGIFSVERAQLLQFRPGHRRKVTSTPYSPTDALRTIECQHGVQPAAWAAADGQLWFSTSRGLLMLDSRNAERQFEAPPAAIEDVTVNGERRGMPATSARCRPGARIVAFSYTGLSYVIPTRIIFSYMLEGFDAQMDRCRDPARGVLHEPPAGPLPASTSRRATWTASVTTRHAPSTSPSRPRYYQRAWFIPLCIGGARAGRGSRLPAAHPAPARAVRPDSRRAEPHRARAARHAAPGLFGHHDGDAGAGAPGCLAPTSGATLEQIVADAGDVAARSAAIGDRSADAARRHIRAGRGRSRRHVAPADRGEGHPPQAEARPAGSRAAGRGRRQPAPHRAGGGAPTRSNIPARARCSWRSTARRHTASQLLVKDDGRGLRRRRRRRSPAITASSACRSAPPTSARRSDLETAPGRRHGRDW